MGLKRRFQNLLRSSCRSASQVQCHQHQCCQHQPPVSSAAVAGSQLQPQLGRRGPSAASQGGQPQCPTRQQQRQQLSRSCERRVDNSGPRYPSFSASSTTSSASSCSSSAQSSGVADLHWRPSRLNFVRLESAEASCCVAELSSSSASGSSSGGSLGMAAAVYEEISEPLYDRVAASAVPEDYDDGGLASGGRYWIYASLPRQRRSRRADPPQQSVQQAPPPSQVHLPLGHTHVDWRGMKCTSF